MKMSEYLHEIKHAASESLCLVWSEHHQLEQLNARIAKLAAEIEASARTVEWLTANPEFDDDLQATAMHWESYFGPEKEQYSVETSKSELELLILAREFSTNAQSGSVLQYAKQGISLVHGGLVSCPDGRLIAGQPIKNVIWQGRNQAIHWEEGTFSKAVQDCFDALSKNVDATFNEYTTRNMAWDIVGLLSWKEFSDFEKDMLSLA